jgi:hypothetical protein
MKLDHNRYRVNILTIALLVMANLSARGHLYVSNLDQTPIGSSAIGSDAWIAQSFSIHWNDPNQYTLDAIQVLLNPATGNPDGLSISIYSAPLGDAPQTYLGSLFGPAAPLAGGIYTYTASGITLSGGGAYLVVMTSATATQEGAFNWSASDQLTSNGDWEIYNIHFTSSDGSAWDRHLRGKVFQMAIHATVVPEPGTAALLGLGLVSLRLFRRRVHQFD